MAHGSSNRTTISLSAVGITSLVLALYLIPFLAPQSRAWGFNNLIFLPSHFLWVYLGLALATLVVMLRPTLFASGFAAVAGIFMSDRYWMRWAVVAAAFTLLFWLLRLPVHLLGDSFSVTANISNDLPIIYKWSETGAIFIAAIVARGLSVVADNPGQTAYGLISILSGGTTVLLFFAIAYELGKDQVERLMIFALSLCAGWVLLFFGYTENYPVLWPFITGYIYFSLRYLNKRGSLIVPAVFLAAAIILHLQALFFVLSFGVVLVAHGLPARLYHRHKKTIAALAVVCGIAALVGLYVLYHRSLVLRLAVMPLFSGSGASGSYTVFSLTHLIDIGNQLLLVMPLFPVLIVAGWSGRKALISDRINRFLLYMTAGGMVFLFLVEPKLGMGRDWDLFALAGFPPMLLLARAVIAGNEYQRYYPGLTLALLALVLPFIAVNLNYDAAVHKYEYLLNLDKSRSRAGVANLREQFANRGDAKAADSLAKVLAEEYPFATLGPRAYQLIDRGDFISAGHVIDSMASLEPHALEVYNLRGILNLRRKNYPRAIEDLQIASQLGRYDSRPLVNLAQAYSQLGRFDDMMAVLRDAQERDSNSVSVVEGLATGYYALGQLDSAFVYGRKLVEFSPEKPMGFIIAGYSEYRRGNTKAASGYFSHFLQMAPDHPQAAEVRRILGSFGR